MTRQLLGRVSGLALGIAVFAAALVAWELGARHEASFLVPPAGEVVQRAWVVWPTAGFLEEVGFSLRRLAAGFLLGAAIGIALGLVVGASRAARRMLEPFLEFMRAVPAIAIVPAAVVVLGLGDASRIVVIAFGVCFPVLVNTADGVRGIPLEVRDTASMLRVHGVERVLRVYFPAALPSIVAGLRTAVSMGLVLVVISEFVGEGNGLGHFILAQQALFNVPDMYAGLLFLGLLGFALNGLFLVAERRVLAWHYGSIGDTTT